MDTHEVSEVLWAHLFSVGYAGATTNIWYYHHAHSQLTHIKIVQCCGRISVVLDMLVLIPIYGTSTTHIPSGQYMKFLKYCGRICVVLDMLVLIPMIGTSTTHIHSGHT